MVKRPNRAVNRLARGANAMWDRSENEKNGYICIFPPTSVARSARLAGGRRIGTYKFLKDMSMNENVLSSSDAVLRRARAVLESSGIREAWQAAGAEVNVVGSMRMGLMAVHRDIDLHVYSPQLDVESSFAAVARIARRAEAGLICCRNLIDTPERCIEWHMAWTEPDGEEWKIDMIHIESGSRYDGFFERVADRIAEVMTPEQRETILRLKYAASDDEPIAGIEYYRAVIEGGVRDMEGLRRWRAEHPADGVTEWMP